MLNPSRLRTSVECRVERWVVAVILLASVKVADAQLTRACCLPNATCAVREPQVCIAQGGVVDSRHTTCANVVCTGACCLPDGRCALVIPQSCIAASGTFDSLGSLCDDVVCGGACCRANGSCAPSNEASCASPSTFQGLGSDCGNVDCKGACCLRDGSCEETGEPGCQSDDGVFQGLSAACADTDCAGACCQFDGSCVETSQPDCVQDRSGEFLGLTATCPTSVCTGACCLADKTCVQTGPGRCAQFLGVYQGRESICGDECPVAMPTAFTYQGQLKRGGVPLNGQIDARFTLWISPTGQDGSDQIGRLLRNAIEVANGLFSVELDFGQNAFNGNARWLQIEIHGDTDPPGAFITLLPRQLLTATPYALQTRGIVVRDNGNVGIGTKTPSGPLTVHSSGVGLMHEDGNVELATYVDSVSGYLGTFSSHPLSLLSGSLKSMTILPSGNVGIGTTAPEVRLHITGGSDAEPPGGGFLQLGSSSGENVSIDSNEIMARNNGATSTLFINNDGGDVHFGGRINSGRINVRSTLAGSVFIGDERADLSGFFVCPPGGGCGELAYSAVDGKIYLFADVKNFRIPNPNDPSTEIWYASVEGPEAAAYVRGTSRLVGGTVTIQLPEHFKVVAAEGTMTVQLTPLSAQSKGLSITRKSLDGIEVQELNSGTGEYDFDWEVKAVRKGYEDYQVIHSKQ